MTATSARGSIFLHPLQKFDAGHLRHHQIGEHDVRGLLFEQRQRGFAALRFHAGETQCLANRTHKRANAFLIVHDQQTNAQVCQSQSFPHGLFYHRNKLLDAERLLHAGRAGRAQRRDSFFIGHIAGDEHHTRSQFRTVGCNPGVNVGAVHSPGVRMSETTPMNSPDSSSCSPSTPDSLHTTA